MKHLWLNQAPHSWGFLFLNIRTISTQIVRQLFVDLYMKNNKINISEKLKKFSDYWSPKVVAEMNDYQFKLAKISGEFIWHHHESTDEVFFVIEGSMSI